ncbi:hypothetical protein SSX86_013062 [Deinandra increscens subsp. villosa]|uniref:TIR domain-containing protein n=1 Tax=Deinandra increscens subsp. villosa TaxID=3103831 RepID=A0AAP0D6Y5_9ASTR
MAILNEVVEASSSSSPPTYDHIEYDVFLSFRGADTRIGFTNYLHTALKDASLITFYDDQAIQTGESLKPELENAIKASRASVVVLSKNYASSTWCLDELVLILEQKRDSNQIVIPIFYHVEPADIRKQLGSFGEAMEEQRLKMEAKTNVKEKSLLAEKIEIWKNALTEVSNLKGMDARGRLERDLIEDIVNDLSIRLDRLDVASSTSTPSLLIGMEDEIKRITSWLTDGSSHTADILTITGVGGIGKTSLANYVYTLHCSQFTCSSFVNNINMRHDEKFQGLLDIQKQLYGDISKGKMTRAHDVSRYTSMIEKTLALKKVFLVLDDINSLEQLDVLLGNKGFHKGSKIIITTKDTSLTERCKLIKTQVQHKHTQILLGGLWESDSLRLLCIHAFKCHKPQKGYEKVSGEIVKFCGGHPLALEVLGSSLHKRDVTYWEECIEGLKKEPNFDVQKLQKLLKISYDSLPFENDKELFKYIACFFVGRDRDFTETILNACDIRTRSGIINLNDRCLLSVTRNNKLLMHSLIQAMGRDLVRQESPKKPWERSRLWCHEESFKVLKQSEGTENVLGLALDMRMLEKDKLKLKTDALCKMNNLKLLQLNYVKINGSYKNISKELRWLCMHGFHFKTIPSNLPMENLVVLDMSHSKIESFDMSYSSSQRVMSKLKGVLGLSSEYKQVFGSLKILDLSFSEMLHSLGGFYHLPALEQLILSNCTSLITVCESIEHCVELLFVDISNCKKLGKLPRNIGKLKKIKTLLAVGCDLLVFPSELRDMDSLQTLNLDKRDRNYETSSSSSVEVIPRDLNSFMSFLPVSLVNLSLVRNNLTSESFPESFSGLYMLKTLNLDFNPLVSMPCCLSNLPRLETLRMLNTELLETVEHPPSSLRLLVMGHANGLRKLKFNPKMSPIALSTLILDLQPMQLDGIIEVQPLEHVEDKVLRSLGWANFESLKYQQHPWLQKSLCAPKSVDWGVESTHRSRQSTQGSTRRVLGVGGEYLGSTQGAIGHRQGVLQPWQHLVKLDERHKQNNVRLQMFYEFGIFSTYYGGEEMPNWISCRSKEGSTPISFTIPPSSSPNKLRGLNFCYVLENKLPNLNMHLDLQLIIIRNITKNGTWIYDPHYSRVEVAEDCCCLICVSHWMFGINEMKEGDQITISTAKRFEKDVGSIRECGIGFVYDDDEEEEEDVLAYYKSWNHVHNWWRSHSFSNSSRGTHPIQLLFLRSPSYISTL